MKKNTSSKKCPACSAKLPKTAFSPEGFYNYCPHCGVSLTLTTSSDSPGSHSFADYTLDSPPALHEIQFSLGPYQVLQSIGKGGMGEVFLAFDSTTGRRVALKKIRDDLREYPRLQARFLKEARITSQLTHPTIIPIYTIHGEKDAVYYTMPYVEGETLKEILRRTYQQERKGKKPDFSGSIPSLMRIFLSVCQAVAYAHSHQIVHRDLKPENIIVGKYGEVLILDWGLAQRVREHEQEELPAVTTQGSQEELTVTGRIVGTVNFMAPERALGQPASLKTDVYSLGVILYQILTLRLPFHRESIEEFRQHHQKEEWINPVEMAPYRDVPRILCRIVKKALAPAPEDRYQSVDEMIYDLEHFTEGRSEWFEVAALDPCKKSDWEFQEHVFIAEHVAITQHTDIADWVHLMVSKNSFAGNLRLEARVFLHAGSAGLGFLLNVPERSERRYPHDGYCLWLSSDLSRSTKLLCSTVEVMEAPDVFLEREQWHLVRIEKQESRLSIFVNDSLQFSYVSYLPMPGTHVGLLSRDEHYSVEGLSVSVGSLSVNVNCLAVPDAFLATGNYEQALSEYRRIADSFPGRPEGSEALFRAGIAFLDQAIHAEEEGEKQRLFDLALDEFEKLRATPGAPLEYLGKALVYQQQEDFEEELKCFELAYRRYRRHPALEMLKEQTIYRMHDTARQNRLAAYHFILLVLHHLKEVVASSHAERLFDRLQRHWEPLPFVEKDPLWEASAILHHRHFSSVLAFWVGRPYAVVETLHVLFGNGVLHPTTIANALFCLVELGSWHLAKKEMASFSESCDESERQRMHDHFFWLEKAIQFHERPVGATLMEVVDLLPESPSVHHTRTFFHGLEEAMRLQEYDTALAACARAEGRCQFDFHDQQRLELQRIWITLLLKRYDVVGELLHRYPPELLHQESNILHSLYGCWLLVAEGKEIARVHFAGVLDTTYPRSWTLLSHYLMGKATEGSRWWKQAFLWEKRQLYRQLHLYAVCNGDDDAAHRFKKLADQQYIDLQ